MLVNRTRVLVVEPVDALSMLYCKHLEEAGHIALPVKTVAVAVQKMSEYKIDIAIVDCEVSRSGLSGLLLAGNDSNPDMEMIILAKSSDISVAMHAVRRGAFDYLMKPVSKERLLTTLRNAIEQSSLKAIVQQYKEDRELSGLHGLLGKSLSMQAVYRTINHIAPSNGTVFISGKAGTGKRATAHALHKASIRGSQNFVHVNCAAKGGENLEVLLFGSLPTSKDSCPNAGAIRQADGGTLFLDNIDSLSIDMQKKLLRFAETGLLPGAQGFGGSAISNVRMVCACAENTRLAISEGRFSQELFCALNVHPLGLPDLSDREGDLSILVESFIKIANETYGHSVHSLSSGAIDILKSHVWMGNVAELKSYITDVVKKSRSGIVSPQALPPFKKFNHELSGGNSISELSATLSENGLYDDVSPANSSLEELERWIIESRIKSKGGSIPKAAQSLGISPSTIYRKREGWVGHAHAEAV